MLESVILSVNIKIEAWSSKVLLMQVNKGKIPPHFLMIKYVKKKRRVQHLPDSHL